MHNNLVVAQWFDALSVRPPVNTVVLIYCPVADPENGVWLGIWDGRDWKAVPPISIDDPIVDYWAFRPAPPQSTPNDPDYKKALAPIGVRRRKRGVVRKLVPNLLGSKLPRRRRNNSSPIAKVPRAKIS